ncbi:hypothetical protein C2G38_2109010, partial [Gigaspora rosea]
MMKTNTECALYYNLHHSYNFFKKNLSILDTIKRFQFNRKMRLTVLQFFAVIKITIIFF